MKVRGSPYQGQDGRLYLRVPKPPEGVCPSCSSHPESCGPPGRGLLGCVSQLYWEMSPIGLSFRAVASRFNPAGGLHAFSLISLQNLQHIPRRRGVADLFLAGFGWSQECEDRISDPLLPNCFGFLNRRRWIPGSIPAQFDPDVCPKWCQERVYVDSMFASSEFEMLAFNVSEGEVEEGPVFSSVSGYPIQIVVIVGVIAPSAGPCDRGMTYARVEVFLPSEFPFIMASTAPCDTGCGSITTVSSAGAWIGQAIDHDTDICELSSGQTEMTYHPPWQLYPNPPLNHGGPGGAYPDINAFPVGGGTLLERPLGSVPPTCQDSDNICPGGWLEDVIANPAVATLNWRYLF